MAAHKKESELSEEYSSGFTLFNFGRNYGIELLKARISTFDSGLHIIVKDNETRKIIPLPMNTVDLCVWNSINMEEEEWLEKFFKCKKNKIRNSPKNRLRYLDYIRDSTRSLSVQDNVGLNNKENTYSLIDALAYVSGKNITIYKLNGKEIKRAHSFNVTHFTDLIELLYDGYNFKKIIQGPTKPPAQMTSKRKSSPVSPYKSNSWASENSNYKRQKLIKEEEIEIDLNKTPNFVSDSAYSSENESAPDFFAVRIDTIMKTLKYLQEPKNMAANDLKTIKLAADYSDFITLGRIHIRLAQERHNYRIYHLREAINALNKTSEQLLLADTLLSLANHEGFKHKRHSLKYLPLRRSCYEYVLRFAQESDAEELEFWARKGLGNCGVDSEANYSRALAIGIKIKNAFYQYIGHMGLAYAKVNQEKNLQTAFDIAINLLRQKKLADRAIFSLGMYYCELGFFQQALEILTPLTRNEDPKIRKLAQDEIRWINKC